MPVSPQRQLCVVNQHLWIRARNGNGISPVVADLNDCIAAFERLLHAADGFILASRYEGLSLAVLSALCSGPKMFLSRVPGNKCLARLGFDEVSWLDPDSSSDSFGTQFEKNTTEAVRAWLRDPRLSSAAHTAKARISFDVTIQMRKVFRLYDHLVGVRRSLLRRLLIVSEPGKDGVFDYVSELATHLHRTRPEIVVDLAYSSMRSGKGLPLLVEQNREWGGEAIDLRIGNMPKPADFRAGYRLAALVRRRKTQLIHAQSSKAGGLCRLVRDLIPGFPPVIYSPHAYYGVDGRRSLLARCFSFIEHRLGQRGFSVSISPDERTFALKTLGLPPRRVVAIWQGIDTDYFRPPTKEERGAARAEFGFPEGVPVLVTIGRESYQKNYPALYRALDPILADPANTLLFFHAGAGGKELGEAWLSSAARKHFIARGFVGTIERLLWAADGFILTSRYEGLSLTVLDSLRSGRKVFLSRVTGNACLQQFGFSEISWIEPDGAPDRIKEPFGPLFEARITEAVRVWLKEGCPRPSPEQAVLARTQFNIDVQMKKLFHLYDHLNRYPE